MLPKRILVLGAIGLVLFVAGSSVAAANHGGAPATVEPTDRSPGADGVGLESHTIATAGTDQLREIHYYFHDGMSPEDCTVLDSRTYGIDRGNNNSGSEVDYNLIQHTQNVTFTEDAIYIEFDEDTPGLNAGDAIVSVQDGCYATPDEAGWYQVTGHFWGAEHFEGDLDPEEPYVGESHHYWICDCEGEDDARSELGLPPGTLEDGAVAIEDQTSDGASVTVATANVPQGGHVAVYDEIPDPVELFLADHRAREELVDQDTWESGFLGAAQVDGEESDVTVELDRAPEGESEVFVVAHRDENGDGAFDWIESGGLEDTPFVLDRELEYRTEQSEEYDTRYLTADVPIVTDSATVTFEGEAANGTDDTQETAGDDSDDGEAEEDGDDDDQTVEGDDADGSDDGDGSDGDGNESDGDDVEREDDDEESPGDGAGFGPVVALVAVLAAVLLGRRGA